VINLVSSALMLKGKAFTRYKRSILKRDNQKLERQEPERFDKKKAIC
jgi:hypothetical protein